MLSLLWAFLCGCGTLLLIMCIRQGECGMAVILLFFSSAYGALAVKCHREEVNWSVKT